MVKPALDGHGVDSGRHPFLALDVNGLGQDGGRGRPVAGDIARFAGDLLDHLCAHVFKLVVQLNFLGHGDAVFGHRRRTESFFQKDIVAPRPEGHLHGICQRDDAPEHLLPGLGAADGARAGLPVSQDVVDDP